MKKNAIYQKYMLRPLIYMAAYRLMLGGILLLALPRLLRNGPSPSLIAGFLAVVFALCAYLVYLRMDGLRIPRVKYIRPKKKSDPTRHFSSMSDHADDDPGPAFDELELDERDFCSLVSSLICLAVFTVLSFVL